MTGSSVAYQDGIGALVFVMLLSSAVELFLVDLLLSVLWMRLLALALGMLGLLVMFSFVIALRAYPHRIADGALTIHYGACFDLSIPLELVGTVNVRRAMTSQRRTAEVSNGVLSLPVMGISNLVLTLQSPITVHLRKSGVAAVREIQVFAVEPESGALKLQNGVPDGNDHRVSLGKRPLWERALRWAGPVVLLVELALVTTGLLDWRVAAGVLAVTEGTLTVLGVAAGAALVSHYRRCRAESRSRMSSLHESVFFLMPTPMAGMVRKELSLVRVLALAVGRRTEGARPDDVVLGYGAVARKALLGSALLLLAAGTTLLIGLAPSVPWIALGCTLLYGAVLTAAVGVASKVRPHVLRGDILLVRWGLHRELAVPLVSAGSVCADRPTRGMRSGKTSDGFPVPGSGRERVVLQLDEPVAVPARLGRQRLVKTITIPVDEGGPAAAAITAQTGRRCATPREAVGHTSRV
jgi:hypothetical protein